MDFFMAIYLDNQTGPVLKRLLEKRLVESPKDFVTQRLLDMVISDDKRKEDIGNCEHEKGKRFSQETLCIKCGSYYEPGMGIESTTKREGEQTTHQP